MATLDHSSIATIYDLGENAGFTWYRIQLVEGSLLAQLLEANGHLGPRLVVRHVVCREEATVACRALGGAGRAGARGEPLRSEKLHGLAL